MKTAGNFSYPASSASVVFGGHLSARAAFRLEPPLAVRQEIARSPHLRVASYAIAAILETLFDDTVEKKDIIVVPILRFQSLI